MGNWIREEAEDPFRRRESKYPGGEAGMVKWPIGKETGRLLRSPERTSVSCEGLWKSGMDSWRIKTPGEEDRASER